MRVADDLQAAEASCEARAGSPRSSVVGRDGVTEASCEARAGSPRSSVVGRDGVALVDEAGGRPSSYLMKTRFSPEMSMWKSRSARARCIVAVTAGACAER
jgi:hypothetical protein